uniref:Uncharacterized protein n=1 Tax=Anopheles coluzzii TaxID=1518534 RepID=A0A8W7PXM2_ANOCL
MLGMWWPVSSTLSCDDSCCCWSTSELGLSLMMRMLFPAAAAAAAATAAAAPSASAPCPVVAVPYDMLSTCCWMYSALPHIASPAAPGITFAACISSDGSSLLRSALHTADASGISASPLILSISAVLSTWGSCSVDTFTSP